MAAVPWRRAELLVRRLGMVEMRRPAEDDAKQNMAELLVAVGARRDVGAFEVLFRHFAPRVKAYMGRLAGDSQAAEELMQETMIAVWNKADRFDPAKGAVSTWIFTIARNLRIDAFRRDKRPDFDPNDPAFVQDDVAPADEAFDAQEASAQLHQAIAALPQEQVALLKLAYFEDNSHSAIAASLNLPLGTVKSRLRLAFAKLRAALDRNGEAT
jgi:RNA polymerase sigma-70 factor (ECF subfamily)